MANGPVRIRLGAHNLDEPQPPFKLIPGAIDATLTLTDLLPAQAGAAGASDRVSARAARAERRRVDMMESFARWNGLTFTLSHGACQGLQASQVPVAIAF